MEEKVEKTVYAGLLYQIYGKLLTDKQQNLVRAYYYDDLSLGEIGENFSISRQAASDQIRRAVDRMKEYEADLHILADQKELYERIQQVLALLNQADEEHIREARRILQNLTNDHTLLT